MLYLFNKIFKIKKSILLNALAVLTCITTGYSQLSEQDLLNSLAVSDKQYHDSIYYELFKVTMNDSLIKSKEYAFKSYFYAKDFRHHVGIAKACRAISCVYKSEHKRDSSFVFLYEGIEVYKIIDSDGALVGLLNDMGVLYEGQDQYDSAMKYYNDGLEMAISLNDMEGQAAIHNNIGLVYYYLEQFSEAMNHLQEAIAINVSNNMESELWFNKLNSVLVVNDLGNQVEAFDILNGLDKKCDSVCSETVRSEIFYGYGLTYLLMDSVRLAQRYFIKCVEFSRECNNMKALGNGLFHLGEIALANGDLELSSNYLKEAELISRKLKLRRLTRDIYKTKFQLYEKKRDLHTALEYQKKFVLLKDSIFNEQVVFNISILRFDAQKKQSDLVIQQKEAELQRSQMIIVLVVIIAALLILVVWLFYKRFRTNRRLRDILEKQVRLRTSDLVQNNYELRQVNAEFEALLRQTSKYIRAPLATLMGLIDLVEKDQDDPQQTQAYIAQIKKIAGSMGLSMDQLKEVRKIKGVNKVTLESSSTRALGELLVTKQLEA